MRAKKQTTEKSDKELLKLEIHKLQSNYNYLTTKYSLALKLIDDCIAQLTEFNSFGNRLKDGMDILRSMDDRLK